MRTLARRQTPPRNQNDSCIELLCAWRYIYGHWHDHRCSVVLRDSIFFLFPSPKLKILRSPTLRFLRTRFTPTVVNGKNAFTDYEVKVRTNLPVFRLKESSVRRRYSDFDWLRAELERSSKIMVRVSQGRNLEERARGITCAACLPACLPPLRD